MAVLVVFVSAMAMADESNYKAPPLPSGHADLQGMWVTAIWDTQQLTSFTRGGHALLLPGVGHSGSRDTARGRCRRGRRHRS